MKRKLSLLSLVLHLTLVSYSLLYIGTAYAQSGRSHRKAEPIPVPKLESDKTNAQIEKPKDEEARFSLVVVSNPLSALDNIPIGYQQTIFNSFMKRLGTSSSLKVIGEEDMNRSEAIKRAKTETERFVVWLSIGLDAQGVIGQDSLSSLTVEYIVFTPTTGKTKSQGRVYPQLRKPRGIIGLPLPEGRIPDEIALRRSGEEAAERVIKSFNLPIPPNRSEPF
jgi:hypothetical protein